VGADAQKMHEPNVELEEVWMWKSVKLGGHFPFAL